MKELITAIKAKKELANLDDSFVKERIEKIFAANHTIKKKYQESKSFKQFTKSKEWETVLKTIRKELRSIYGVFQEDRSKIDTKNITALLETHISTRERLPYYDEIYGELAARIPTPTTIVDLGCGLNPVSYEYMKQHGWTPHIIGVDISSRDMNFLQEVMNTLNIPGETMTCDLVKQYKKLDNIQADVTFVLKLLDTLEDTERYISYKLFEHIHSPWIVVSFATKSLGGKKTLGKRTWFERLLQRRKLQWETFHVENEMFYVIHT